jgi:hypothetical protein
MIRVQNRVLVLIAVIACGFALPAGAQPYYLADLGAVAPGLAINNSGQVSLLNGYYSGGTYTPYPASLQNAPSSGGGGGVGASWLLMLGGLLAARQLKRTARP